MKTIEKEAIHVIIENFVKKEKENLSSFELSVISAWLSGYTPLLVGPTGVGKTEMTFELVKKINVKFLYFNSPNLSEVEVGALPLLKKEEGFFSYALPEWVVDEEPAILFFDELNRVMNKSVMNAFMNMFKEGVVANRKLKNKLFIVAVNPEEDEYNVLSMDLAHKRRFLTIKVNPTWEQFKKFYQNRYSNSPIVKAIDHFNELYNDNIFLIELPSKNILSPALIEKLDAFIEMYLKIAGKNEDSLANLKNILKQEIGIELANFVIDILSDKLTLSLQIFINKNYDLLKKFKSNDIINFIIEHIQDNLKIFNEFFEKEDVKKWFTADELGALAIRLSSIKFNIHRYAALGKFYMEMRRKIKNN